MNGYDFTLAGARVTALPSGGLWWADARLLAVSDLHLGKSERMARRGGALLPPYDTAETLSRLEDDIAATAPATVICLGDSFDDDTAARALPDWAATRLTALMAGRRWIWITGNHDPGPTGLAGTHLAEAREGPLTFRHIADPDAPLPGEVSGHYHPKTCLTLRGRRITRRCLLTDGQRAILPAYGAYTGGLACTAPVLDALMGPRAVAILLGTPPVPVPMRV
ncbi:ligase-associated DNA damage response endonuclease PdeM [Rhodovulum adriaticum]|uniref:Putative phosphoesterase n=1 Tax=Rhodovulum adriaticum TaxID=35804 RepID=A0A4V2SLB4_RHOAD|nr:ligase-associated DNA damage response endonuclease PdeM [Rhodovulum adriaticum]MBK1636946.1 metallophosphoesterase [Rhodovulum adriaticum]TCP22746.1 putative phosphoesterase [Rhodovulum adriaticum]